MSGRVHLHRFPSDRLGATCETCGMTQEEAIEDSLAQDSVEYAAPTITATESRIEAALREAVAYGRDVEMESGSVPFSERVRLINDYITAATERLRSET